VDECEQKAFQKRIIESVFRTAEVVPLGGAFFSENGLKFDEKFKALRTPADQMSAKRSLDFIFLNE